MRPSDLPPVQELAKNKPHGHKLRYVAGCRCRKCREGNAVYERKLKENRAKYGINDLVSTAEARKHLLWIQRTFGMGHKTVGPACGVGKTVIGEIIWPGNSGRTHIRRRTANKILAYVPVIEHLPKFTMIDATDTLKMFNQLLLWGIPALSIGRDGLGAKSYPQIHSRKGKTKYVLLKTYLKIRDFYRKIVQMREFWTQHFGPIPPRHYVYWKRGRHGMTVRSFELRPFAVTYDFHYVYSQDLKDAMRAKARLQKTYRSKSKAA